MSNNEISKVIVYENGDTLDKEKCRRCLWAYWELNSAEKRAFDRLQNRVDLKKMRLNLLDNEESD